MPDRLGIGGRRAPGEGGHREECLVVGVGRASRGGAGRRACAMHAAFSQTRRRPPKVAGGISTVIEPPHK
jgi:hypothetical protein